MTSEIDKVQTRQFTDEELGAINSWADIANVATEKSIVTVDISDFGTGFTVLDNKDKQQLIGVEFAILDWRFHMGDHGEYVSLAILTRDGRKLIVNDGSSGIYKDMLGVDKRLPSKGIVRVGKGLTVSEYTFVDSEGEEKPAKTYYLNFGR